MSTNIHEALKSATPDFDQTHRLSLFDNKRDNKPKPIDTTWADICEFVSNPQVRADKDGPLFSPATFSPQHRCVENVVEVSALCMDYDHGANFDRDTAVWRALGVRFAAYTTHSHGRQTKNNPEAEERFRIIIPFAVPIPATKFPALWRWGYEKSGGLIDEAAKDASRMSYSPAIASDDAPYRYEINDGSPLDWRTLDLEDVVQSVETVQRPPLIATTPKPANGGLRAGDDYNERGLEDFRGLLIEDGWTYAYDDGKGEAWVRPGKDPKDGISAHLYSDTLKFHVFTDAAPPFEPNETYDLFTGCALLRYAGDHKAAAKDLGKQGYGPQIVEKDEEESAESTARLFRRGLSELATEDGGEEILVGLRRGQPGALYAAPNAGKTTLARNLTLCLATGKPYLNIIPENSPPRRVAFLDCEDAAGQQGADVREMWETGGFNDVHKEGAEANTLWLVDAEISGKPVSLSNPQHFAAINKELQAEFKEGLDLIIIDTMAAGFEIENENDNALVMRAVVQPLKTMARLHKCAVLLVHHIGKKGENGHTEGNRIYGGRGASSLSGAARVVYDLQPVTENGQTYTRFGVPKIKKRPKPADVKLTLNGRWFELEGVTTPQKSPYDIALEGIREAIEKADGKLSRQALIAATKLSKTTLGRHLETAVQNGQLNVTREGKEDFYSIPAE